VRPGKKDSKLGGYEAGKGIGRDARKPGGWEARRLGSGVCRRKLSEKL